MATTTPNFGWTVPTSSDLVKDGAVAIETLGDSIDTSLVDLKGGTTGQILSKTSGTDMDFTWITAAGGGTKSFALLNSGGTSLSTGTTTISSIGGYDQFLILVSSASSTSANVDFTIRFNSDTGGNYSYYGAQGRGTTNYESANIHTAMQGASQTSFLVSTGSNDAGSASSIGMFVSGANTSGIKVVDSTASATANGGVNHYSRWFKGIWNNSSVISSISIISSAGTFDTGTIFVYGAV
jgi:hypothetical protein